MERLLTTEEVAELLRIDPVTVRRLVTRGELPASRIAGEYRFIPTDIERFVENQRVIVTRVPERLPPVQEMLPSLLERMKPMPMTTESKHQGDRLTKRARTALSLALEESTQYHHIGLGTEHLLLAIIEEGGGVGAEALRRLEVQPRAVREQIEVLHPEGEQPGDQAGMTPPFTASLVMAVEEARSLGHQHAGTGHLLLGILRDEAGFGGRVLLKSGVTLERMRGLVTQLHADEDEMATD